MFYFKYLTRLLLTLVTTAFLITGSRAADDPGLPGLDVYKNPACGCCHGWITHLAQNGFIIIAHDIDNLSPLKTANNIEPRYESCHTAIAKNGYVFEGHVPANTIRRFLLERPKDAIGLSVPGMVAGSPGMEYGDNFTPYSVLLLKKDGSSRVYARIKIQKEQY